MEGNSVSLNRAAIDTRIRPSPGSRRTCLLPKYNGLGFGPYEKIIINIDYAQLSGMTQGWNSKECEEKRRIVRTSKSQEGAQINLNFDPLPEGKWEPNMICMSCIFWEGKHYFTCVDFVDWHESIIEAKLDGSKKRRIRRNLDCFKAQIVPKADPEWKGLFDLIMEFPLPRPRKTAIDVNLFEWKDIEKAMTKIFGIYTTVSAIYCYI